MKIDIKPLSVNQAWQGRRFKTKLYKRYEKDVMFLLPSKMDIPVGELKVTYKFGFSNSLSDIDNGIKSFQDILQKYYGFDDRQIFKMIVEKEIVKKGEEFIEFKIESYDPR